MDTLSNSYQKNKLARGVYFLYQLLIHPHSQQDDDRRREFITNVILVSVSLVLILLDVFILRATIIKGPDYRGIPFELFSVIVLFFLFLSFLSRKGYFVAASYILIGLFFCSITYTAYTWGVELPMAVLSYVLIVIIASIVIGTRFGLYMTAIVGATVISLSYMEATGINMPRSYWKQEQPRVNDGIEHAIIYGIIMVVSWLSNREIGKSLQRARTSEKALQQERDLLEVKVQERTKELKEAQLTKMSELYRFAEFGRLSSGLFHDLVNPLNAVTLNIERLQQTSGTLPGIQQYLTQALQASRRMDQFLQALRKQLQTQDIQSVFSVNEEIEQAVELLTHKARQANIRILFSAQEAITLFGNPLKFHQVAQNLISNAIDAYQGTPTYSNREIRINLEKKDRKVVFSVQDYGSGIPLSIQDKIFDPFFTTKSIYKGIGLGLSTTKSVVEKDFQGSISVTSQEGRGTTFTVMLPIHEQS